MIDIGYHASHEQFPPKDLLGHVMDAEEAGSSCAKTSDHFHPWSERQGQSGFAWSWLGAAMQVTRFEHGIISAPGYRYNPAVLAQAAATLGGMFEGRLWLALGSGEAINEAITGLYWPDKAERNARLRECVDIIRALFNGEEVTHRGRVTIVEAKLYSLPSKPVPLFGAAMTEATARFVGSWADGLLTAGGDPGQVGKVIAAFRENGGEGKPVHIQHALSWATSEDEALTRALHQWAPAAIGGRPGICDGQATLTMLRVWFVKRIFGKAWRYPPIWGDTRRGSRNWLASCLLRSISTMWAETKLSSSSASVATSCPGSADGSGRNHHRSRILALQSVETQGDASMAKDQQQDDAPKRSSRDDKQGDLAIVGKSVTVNRPRAELFAFWRDFTNLPKFMHAIERIETTGPARAKWTVKAPAGQTVTLETEVVTEASDEVIGWRSTEASQIRTVGLVKFHDAPADRGTVVTAEIAYEPPAGDLGRLVAKLFGAEPNIQARHELKRFKMLMETGEIATGDNQKTKDGDE